MKEGKEEKKEMEMMELVALAVRSQLYLPGKNGNTRTHKQRTYVLFTVLVVFAACLKPPLLPVSSSTLSVVFWWTT